MASELIPTAPSAWKKAGTGGTKTIELPSGNVVRMRVPGMQAFITMGIIPNSLIGYITSAIEVNKRGKDQQDKPVQEPKVDTDKMMRDILDDPDKLQDMLQLTDAVFLSCVLEPKAYEPPDDGDERDDDLLYVDEIDMNDKMFVFNAAVGGTKDVERFREGSAAGVGAAPARKSVAKATKRTGGARKR